MVAPTNYDVTITIDGVDVSMFVPWNTMGMDDYPKQVSSLNFTVENPVGIVPARGHQVIMIADSLPDTPVIFLGYIRELKTSKFQNSLSVFYEIEAADSKILLQRSVIDIAVLSGSDVDIIQNLLTNAYPDLTGLFDFGSGVDGFIDGLDLPVGNSNILDALKDLADLTGASYSFDIAASGSGDIVTFDSAEDNINVKFSTDSVPAKPYLQYQMTGGSSLAEPVLDVSAGNPTHCARWQPTSGNWGGFPGTGSPRMSPEYVSSGFLTLTNITFDYYINSAISSNVEIHVRIGTTKVIAGLTGDAWTSLDVSASTSFAFPLNINTSTSFFIQFHAPATIDTGTTAVDIRVDNVLLHFDPPIFPSEGGTELQWGPEAPLSDINFNIETGDEFGFNYDLNEGDWDDYNSITVIGGNEERAIDWTYPNQDSQDHINIETDVDDLVVFKNTGTQGSPIWTEQTSGILGTDELGDVDVLYDNVEHWLYFDTAPSDFTNAIRITGTIRIPIKVRVENIEPGGQVYATTFENSAITSEEQALGFGTSKLDERNAVKTLTFVTYEPGLKPGQRVTVTDTARGLDESLVIQRISTKWRSGKTAEFSVECGTAEISTVDATIAANEKRSRNTQLNAGADVVSYAVINDADGIILTDVDNRTGYGRLE